MGEVGRHYFFCGIGGSGMMPLALILHANGHKISGSDRSHDQGKTREKFQKLTSLGITLAPQDGNAIDSSVDVLVVSGAIEDTVPDVRAAQTQCIPIKTRAEILAALFNSFPQGISVAGTSGKSTVTGMIATILTECNYDPTVMNGGIIENLTDTKSSPFPNMRTGHGDYFVTETDESDGSIALYNPAIAVLNNIALDHMPLSDLQHIFQDFLERATKTAIVNLDNEYVAALVNHTKTPLRTYAIYAPADLIATDINFNQTGSSFVVDGHKALLNVPGAHNISNALAAISVALECGIEIKSAIEALQTFTGIRRRMQVVGTQNKITVIDDFAHNPDKIEASLKTLKEFNGRLIIMFQMHGFGPIKLMGDDIINSFAAHLSAEDMLLMPEIFYAGGTVDRSKTAKDMILRAQDKGLQAHWFETRTDAKNFTLQNVQPHDRVIIMGARDDTLSDFAKEILAAV